MKIIYGIVKPMNEDSEGDVSECSGTGSAGLSGINGYAYILLFSCSLNGFYIMPNLRVVIRCKQLSHSCSADRYRSLPSTDRRMQFAHLQLELLEDFRVRLLQVRKEMLDNEPSPITPQMCSILNTVSYIEGVLQQWNNLPVCMSMWFIPTFKCVNAVSD